MNISLAAIIRGDQNGSLFIGLIITMMMFAALGAAMFSFTTTSAFNQVWVNSVSKAYYMAESGFRYAESEYKHTGDTDGDGEIKDNRNQLLEGWNSPDSPGTPVLFTFSDQTENFELKIYPYYVVTAISHSKNATSLQTKFPGAKPAGFPVPSSGRLKIGSDDPYVYTTYNAGTGTFTINPGLRSNLSDNMDVLLIANPSATGTITRGGDLTLSDGSFFPDRNGVFSVHDRGNTVYGYTSRNGNTLQGIFNANDPDGTFADVAVLGSTDIVLNPFVKLTSIGIIEHGGSMDTKREIDYSVPLSTNIEEVANFQDTFEDNTKWDSALGTHSVPTIAGNKALKVSGTGAIGASDAGSLAKFKWSETEMDLGAAHSRGNPFFLSYDAQIKIGFDPSVPSTYMAGLSFRQDAVAAGNSYGTSFLKGGSLDGIPDTLVPNVGWPMLVLWQQTNSGADKKWLGYKYLIGRPVHLDTEKDGWGSWTKNTCAVSCLAFWTGCIQENYNGVLWHQTSTNRVSRNGHATELSYYGQDISDNFYTGTRANCGVLESPAVTLPSAASAFLSFWSWFQTETGTTYDKKYVQISTNGGVSWNDLSQLSTPQEAWKQILIDLSSFAGQTIKIRFKFDTCDCVNNIGEGWYIDDVTISGGFPINKAMLMVRLKESSSLRFTNGGETPIEDGNVVATATGTGLIDGDPILESGSWAAGGNATGLIILRVLSGTFQAGQDLSVGGSVLAKVSSDADFFRTRDNYVKVYFGEAATYGTPNTTPLDFEKRGIPRGEFHWPPDNVNDTTAANDYFTLVQWDKPNTALNSAVGEKMFGTGKELDAIVRLSALTTPASGTFSASEIALHTFGVNSTSVYFDDFGLQAKIFSTGGFFPAVQD